jgi:hypothetical protein
VGYFNVLDNPIDKVVLERPLDKLVKKIREDQLMAVGMRKIGGKGLGQCCEERGTISECERIRLEVDWRQRDKMQERLRVERGEKRERLQVRVRRCIDEEVKLRNYRANYLAYIL